MTIKSEITRNDVRLVQLVAAACALVLACLLLAGQPARAFALGAIDTGASCSIEADFAASSGAKQGVSDIEKVIAAGSLPSGTEAPSAARIVQGTTVNLWRVATVCNESGWTDVQWDADFLAWLKTQGDPAQELILGTDWKDNTSWASVASKLASMVQGKTSGVDARTPDYTTTVGTDGIARFADLRCAVYLMVPVDYSYTWSEVLENGAGSRYHSSMAFLPSLISLPTLNEAENSWVYDVAAIPKCADPGSGPTVDPEPSSGGSGKLPQTGQLWWPVPVLLAIGAVLLAAGYVLRRKAQS